MTDARLPERWLNDRRLLRLSDADFRTFVMSLMWSVSNRTDGRLEPDDLYLVPSAHRGSGPALESAGLWTKHDGHDGWTITDFASTQTSRDELLVLENVRRANREAQARNRAKKKAVPDPEPDHASQPDVRLTHQYDSIGRLGEARPGKARRLETGGQTSGKERHPQASPPSLDRGEYKGGPVPWSNAASSSAARSGDDDPVAWADRIYGRES